jgi:hypothetical protein
MKVVFSTTFAGLEPASAEVRDAPMKESKRKIKKERKKDDTNPTKRTKSGMSEMTEIPGSKSEKHPDSSKARKQPSGEATARSPTAMATRKFTMFSTNLGAKKCTQKREEKCCNDPPINIVLEKCIKWGCTC